MSRNYKSKQLYSIKENGIVIRIRCHYNVETDHSTINTEFNKKYVNNRKYKTLYCITEENIGTQIECSYNINTDHITITTGFYKNGGDYNKSKNNKFCPTYLGVIIAEKILSKIFKKVKVMPYNNCGYDFVCGKDYKIDVKSACKPRHGRYLDRWTFHIHKNKIADYFLCLAFDNRDDLNPQYLWLIPGNILNNNISITISKTTLDKWEQYEQPLDKVISCCNTMKN